MKPRFLQFFRVLIYLNNLKKYVTKKQHYENLEHSNVNHFLKLE